MTAEELLTCGKSGRGLVGASDTTSMSTGGLGWGCVLTLGTRVLDGEPRAPTGCPARDRVLLQSLRSEHMVYSVSPALSQRSDVCSVWALLPTLNLSKS